MPRCRYRVHVCTAHTLTSFTTLWMRHINHVGGEILCTNFMNSALLTLFFTSFCAKNKVYNLVQPYLNHFINITLVGLAWTGPSLDASFWCRCDITGCRQWLELTFSSQWPCKKVNTKQRVRFSITRGNIGTCHKTSTNAPLQVFQNMSLNETSLTEIEKAVVTLTLDET